MIVDNISRPLKIYYDNSFTVFFSKNDEKSSKGAKHMEIVDFAVKEKKLKNRDYNWAHQQQYYDCIPFPKHLVNMLKEWVFLLEVVIGIVLWIYEVYLFDILSSQICL